MDQLGVNNENGAQRTAWSEDFERVPLKQRLKLLLASHRASVGSDVKWDIQYPVSLQNGDASVADERESRRFDLQSHCFAKEHVNGSLMIPKEEGNAGEHRECQESLAHKHASSSDIIADSQHGSMLAEYPGTVNIECANNLAESISTHYLHGSSPSGIQSVAFEPETSEEYLDEFDHVALKERLRRLLKSKCLGLTSSMLQENTAAAVKGDLRLGDQRHEASENQMNEIDRALTSGVPKCTVDSSCNPHQELSNCSQGNRSTYENSSAIKSNEELHFSLKECSRYKSDGEKILPSRDFKTWQGSAMPMLAKIKIEHPTYDEFQTSNVPMVGQLPFWNLIQVKSEVQNTAYEYEDVLDHMLLQERMKLLSSRDGPKLDINQSSKHTSEVGSSASGFTSVASGTAQSLKIKRPRKRRKTVTDSVETAMEEDAPGLLQVLIEKGVSVNEIILYNEPESNDALDDSSTNDDFAELEEVISKVFSRRESLLKLGHLRCSKGERASYCLDCLFSLVEQARYLQFRKWPVEWGWCRDLQSFIFVFERHNRIVLERPEYGYATYFFELAESRPIRWQIKRLVTAMKLTSCGRATLIENKALMVGDDLTEGEARVLMEYGWLPNTGLGTMLNYYDRVVHDRRKEDRSEWRSKIGKLLMDGYNGGTIISTDISPKVECDLTHPLEIKLELR